MKQIITSLIIILIGITSFAQENIKIGGYDQEVKTLFKREKRDGFYGSISGGYSPIDKVDGLTFSARGGRIMDHWFGFGFTGTGFVNNIDELGESYSNATSNSDLNLAGGYGGFFLEPYLFPLKPIHLSFPVTFGVGAAAAMKSYYYSSYYNINALFWVVEPGVELEINFTKHIRIAAYATYRYTPDLKITGINPDALRSYSAGITLKTGLF